MPNTVDDLQRSLRVLARIESLYAVVPEHRLAHINVASGKYTGHIVGVSEAVVQQMMAGDEIFFHQTRQIDRIPALGELCTVQYQGGRASVITHNSPQADVAKESGTERKNP